MRRVTVQRARDSCQDVRAPNSQLGEHCHGDEEAVVSRYSAVGWAWPEIRWPKIRWPEVRGQEVWWEKERAQEIRRPEIGSAQVIPSQIIRTGIEPEVIGA